MPRGGKREGAGRKPGIANRVSRAAQAQIAASGLLTPLDYMLDVLRNGTDESLRFEAAKAAAPYVHPRLTAVEHSGEIETTYVAQMPAPVRDMDEWQRRYHPVQ